MGPVSKPQLQYKYVAFQSATSNDLVSTTTTTAATPVGGGGGEEEEGGASFDDVRRIIQVGK